MRTKLIKIFIVVLSILGCQNLVAQIQGLNEEESQFYTTFELVEFRITQKIQKSIDKNFCIDSNASKFEDIDIFESEEKRVNTFNVKGLFTYNCSSQYKKRKSIRYVATLKRLLGDFAVLKIMVDTENIDTFDKQIFPLE